MVPSAAFNNTSAIPAPSVPGNQAATKASDALSSLFTHIGRPEINTDTTGMPCSFSELKSANDFLFPRSNSRLSLSPCPSA